MIELIERIRKQQRVSKKDLCAKADISTATYWRYITAKADISVKTAQKLANTIGMQITLSVKS